MMSQFLFKCLVLFGLIFTSLQTKAQHIANPEKPWVFWYWMQASVSKEGITADLEAMKEAGIAGAYLMPIKGPTDPPLMEPVINQLTPEWWEMVLFAMDEAKRLNLQLGMHASDGFALAGGPWITPELSMQKVVWSEASTTGGSYFNELLERPESYNGYYQDIAVYAIPVADAPRSTLDVKPQVTTSTGTDAGFLTEKTIDELFRCEEDCWFQYSFEQPFTCQSIRVITKGNNYQSHRLQVEVSDDGSAFRPVYQMQPPRHGWQDTDAEVTYSIPKTTASHYRFRWRKEGTEPGAEDLDAAKWSPRLKLAGLELSNKPRIHQYEGKSGAVWRISPYTTPSQLPEDQCIPLDKVVDLTGKMDTDGRLQWQVPAGNWIILRMGHTSTGHTNATGGGGKGLECDKFNPEAINLQFDNWYGQILQKAGPDKRDALKIFHVDSWECGSQNWSPVFREEFNKRRGYDPLLYLPVMAGVPLNNVRFSENFLYDIRLTISELLVDNFYGTMAQRAHENDVSFSAESVAPTMLSDGMQHYGMVDIPMGEFWLRSPTHDKPNDMLDAISGAHVYEKPIIQAEGFTELRMAWDEHPGMLKTLGDRNYALGINRMAYHVFTHNPWINQKPGMTLDGVGLYFQRDQTWWKPGKAWVQYAERCQTLLQEGKPVIDVAVFTGEGLPRRAILPDRLVNSLPGLFGETIIAQEKERLKNTHQPQREMPAGVNHSANMADPEDWIDPLNGYKYDSFNKDALIRLATVTEGEIRMPGGSTYQLLILPGKRKMAPNPEYMSVEVARKLLDMVKAGLTLLISEKPIHTPGIPSAEDELKHFTDILWEGDFTKIEHPNGAFWQKTVGNGSVIKTPFEATTFEALGIEPDFLAFTEDGTKAKEVAWTHRRTENKDIYFISNQRPERRIINLSLRTTGKLPVIYDPVTDSQFTAREWTQREDRTELPVNLPPNGSLFIILNETSTVKSMASGKNWINLEVIKPVSSNWKVTFDESLGGPRKPVKFGTLSNWIDHPDPAIRHYSGTAIYETVFTLNDQKRSVWIDLGQLANIGQVYVNGVDCGVVWTAPHQIEVTEALRNGKNQLRIEVSNTWRNRLIGDKDLPEEDRITRTTAPYRLEGKPLLDAGLLGPVRILREAD